MHEQVFKGVRNAPTVEQGDPGLDKRLYRWDGRRRDTLRGVMQPPPSARWRPAHVLLRWAGSLREGQVGRLERVVQGDCSAPQKLRLGRGRRAGARDTAPQHHDFVARPQRRAEGGRWQRHCASTPRLRRSTSAGMPWERAEGGRWQRHCASTPRLRRSTSATMA